MISLNAGQLLINKLNTRVNSARNGGGGGRNGPIVVQILCGTYGDTKSVRGRPVVRKHGFRPAKKRIVRQQHDMDGHLPGYKSFGFHR